MTKFWWRSGVRIRIRITTLVRRASAEVCTVAVLIVLVLCLLFLSIVSHSQLSQSDRLLRCIAGYQQTISKYGPMPNVMAALPNIGGAVCVSSVIPFLVPRRKVWLTPAARLPCSNAANIGERKTWTQSEFCTWQNSLRGQQPPKMYILYQRMRRPNIAAAGTRTRNINVASETH